MTYLHNLFTSIMLSTCLILAFSSRKPNRSMMKKYLSLFMYVLSKLTYIGHNLKRSLRKLEIKKDLKTTLLTIITITNVFSFSDKASMDRESCRRYGTTHNTYKLFDNRNHDWLRRSNRWQDFRFYTHLCVS